MRELTDLEKKFVQSIKDKRHEEIKALLKQRDTLYNKAVKLSEKYCIPFDCDSGGYHPRSGRGLDIVLYSGEEYEGDDLEEDFDDPWDHVPQDLRDAIDELGYVSGSDYDENWYGAWMPSRNC